MVLVVSFASSAIVAKHAMQKVMSKIEGEFLFLIQFTKDQKVAVKKSKLVIEAMVKMLEPLTKHTVTPDRGKEFTYHQDLADKLKGEAYFPDPHAPWQRGTNENANGLLREYFPTGSDLTLVDRKSHEYKAIKRYGKLIQQNSRKLSDKRFYRPIFRMHLTNK